MRLYIEGLSVEKIKRIESFFNTSKDEVKFSKSYTYNTREDIRYDGTGELQDFGFNITSNSIIIVADDGFLISHKAKSINIKNNEYFEARIF